ncbi:unnamed protein product [Phytophthora fragariaefolia]|uniref:Unnamed protein product n=1 Tax=Phytophthora fragariaefolia TaxID=1490495 RepID=A0A9W6WTS5_9STRA|nr:unnamed protein product [Phytophthora fragariaefolia]
MDSKRKNFSKADNILLLKQVLAMKPTRGKHGTLMIDWEAVANMPVASPEFLHDNLGAKTAQNRSNLLLAEFDDWRHQCAVDKDASVAKAIANEKAGEVFYLLAVECLKWRAAGAWLVDARPAKAANFYKIAQVLAEYIDKELEFRREQWHAQHRL